jgi:predicted amidohydrolase
MSGSGKLSIAVAQPLVVPGDVAENVRRMAPLVAEAASRGARLICFSECGLTGYDHAGVGVASAIAADDPAIDAVAKMAASYDVAIVVGFYERDGAETYNRAMLVRADGSRVAQRKHAIIDWEAAHTAVRSAPRERAIFDVEGVRSAILICADTGMPGIYEELAAAGVRLVLTPTAGCGETAMGYSLASLAEDEQMRSQWLARQHQVSYPQGSVERSRKYGHATVAVNQAGYEPSAGFFHPGHSSVVDADGRVAALIGGEFAFEHLRPLVAVGTLEAI